MSIKAKNSVCLLLLSLGLVSFFTACAFNQSQQTPELRKSQFEQAFAEQCVEKEIRNSINKEVDRLRFTKPCSCIAKRISGNLAGVEMDKFLLEQKVTHSLKMSFDKAAYFCVQTVATPKSRFLHGKKQ